MICQEEMEQVLAVVRAPEPGAERENVPETQQEVRVAARRLARASRKGNLREEEPGVGSVVPEEVAGILGAQL